MANYSAERTTAATRFDKFNIHSTTYKAVNGQGIAVYVLVPKDIKPGKHPLHVKFHGGSLVTGDAIYPDWFANYIASLALRNSALTILPNYRLLPEHTTQDILDDIDDLWKWVSDTLPSYLAEVAPGVQPDYSRILCGGESAGGWLAAQSVFAVPKGHIKALLVQYPMFEKAEYDPITGPALTLGFGVRPPPPEFLDEHLASVAPGSVVTSATPPARTLIGLALGTSGRKDKYFGKGKHVWPMQRVEDATWFPSVYSIHGKDDSMVPFEYSEQFLAKLHKKLPDVKTKLRVEPGEHGFDTEFDEESVKWLGEDMKWVEKEWLGA